MRLVAAALVADGAGVCAAPGGVLLQGRRVLAAGPLAAVRAAAPAGVEEERHPLAAVIPALVNAHAHLDLTALGCWPARPDFDGWLAAVREARSSMDAAATERSTLQGVSALVAGGVAAVGDIASPPAVQACLRGLAAAGVGGVVFTEVFGVGKTVPAAVAAVERMAAEAAGGRGRGTHGQPLTHRGLPLCQGVQPHAPYSSDQRVFVAALESGLPVSTHLAESVEETEFLRDGTGRFRALLEHLGLWDGSLQTGARHPVDWMAGVLRQARGARTAASARNGGSAHTAGTAHIVGSARRPLLAAHCNEMDDQAMDALVASGIVVAYCPRASAYFGHTGHRYRQMLARGVTVALGTDSMLCLDTPDRISTLDDLRLLMRRDGLDIQQALALATVNGARALGLPEGAFQLKAGEHLAGLLAVPLAGAAETGSEAVRAFQTSQAGPIWILGPISEPCWPERPEADTVAGPR